MAVKIAPFNRYQTLDVVRAVAESGRNDVALYTGNDDNIVLDLLTPFRFRCGGQWIERRIVGGLLGHWAVWTRRAVELLEECHRLAADGAQARSRPPCSSATSRSPTATPRCSTRPTPSPAASAASTRSSAARGCCRAHGASTRSEQLSPGQAEEIDRVAAAYPHLTDDAFVREHRDAWSSG